MKTVNATCTCNHDKVVAQVDRAQVHEASKVITSGPAIPVEKANRRTSYGDSEGREEH